MSHSLKYQRIADELRSAILAGHHPPGSKLPGEAVLARDLQVSVVTLRRALRVLAEQGLVYRRPGSGTFVTHQTPDSAKATIGVLLPDLKLFYPKVLQGIVSELEAHGYGFKLATSANDGRNDGPALHALRSSGIDGIICAPFSHNPVPSLTGIPYVLVERDLDDFNPAAKHTRVRSDHAGGIYDAYVHLHGLGHRRIALLLRSPGIATPDIVRGYRVAVENHRGRGHIGQAPMGQWARDKGVPLWREAITWRASAAIVVGDIEAILLQKALIEGGHRLPEDFSMISQDDELAASAPIPLTAVSQEKYLLGKLAASLVMEQVEAGGRAPIQRVSVRPRLAIRQSCCPL